MFWLQLLFWTTLFILFYCFIGYAVLLWIAAPFRKQPVQKVTGDELPALTMVIAAYNEKEFIEEKIANTLSLTYPAGKIKYLIITDGSDDGTDKIVAQYPQVVLLHQPERKGKSEALNRAVNYVDTPLIVFSDANTILNKEALLNLVKHYADEKTGGVSGEKKISSPANQSGSGEGFYWLYESQIKKLETKFYSLVGSAGELFSIRTALFQLIPANIILDDFYIALCINRKGYKVIYEPAAFSSESPSASLKEEQKRKVRIAAGAFQSVSLFKDLLNISKHPAFAFQFFSHKILRWYAAPVCILIVFITNYFLSGYTTLYQYLWYAQLVFYILAVAGWLFQKYKQFTPLFYFPYYFLFMNYCTVLGWIRYRSGKQDAIWEKSKRVAAAIKPVSQ